MGLLDRLFGNEPQSARPAPRAAALNEDDQAIERYRYMVRTAPPETLEQAYAEGFAKLTPEQRERVRAELTEGAPAGERDAIAGVSSGDTRGLARAATRAEIRQPGAMERALGAGSGLGAAGFGANLLSSFAMGFVGSMVAQSFFSALGGFDGGADQSGGDADGALASAEGSSDDASGNEGDYADDSGDFGEDFDV